MLEEGLVVYSDKGWAFTDGHSGRRSKEYVDRKDSDLHGTFSPVLLSEKTNNSSIYFLVVAIVNIVYIVCALNRHSFGHYSCIKERVSVSAKFFSH